MARTPDNNWPLEDAASGVALRWMRDEPAEFELLARWLSDERVLEWVYGRDDPYSLEDTLEKFGPRTRGEDPVRPCFMLADGQPVGYLQYYPVEKAEDYELETAEHTWGLDLFIGEPDFWNRGIGTTTLQLIIRHLFDHRAAQRIVIDPRVDNPRAIRCYEKAGFRKIKILHEHELHEGTHRDCWLMATTTA